MTSRSVDIHDDAATASYQSLKGLEQQQKSLVDLLAFEQEDEEFNGHVDQIISTLTHTIYQVVSWAMFAEHKLIFSFSICVNILKHNGPDSGDQKISESEYNFFLNSTLLADMQLDALTEKIENIKE